MWYKFAKDKVLILMRGVPGSGKSYLANQLGSGGVVYSTDDFFYDESGTYQFNPKNLGKNHSLNLQRTIKAMEEGVTPIVVDNTNIKAYEMKNYVLAAERLGYRVDFRSPETDWAWNAEEATKRNQHGVPQDKIQSMIDNFDPNTDIEHIKQSKAPWEK